MAVITFYGKPNCINNRKQRDLLIQAGHTVMVRDIRLQRWTQESLHSFLKSRSFEEWFNPSAPDIQSGNLDPDILSDSEALHLMLEAPNLINGPLLEFDDYRLCGFDAEELDAIIGLEPLNGDQQRTASRSREGITLEKKAS